MNIQCANLNDLRMVDENGAIELDRVTIGDSSSTDGNVTFELANPIEAGIHHGIFYIYTNNSNCPSPPTDVNYEGTDNFEDGDYTSDPTWTVVGDTGGTLSVTGDAAYNGNYGLRLAGDGAGENTITTPAVFDNLDTWAYFRTSDYTSGEALLYYFTGAMSVARFYVYQSKFQYSDSGGMHDFTETPSNDTWYIIRMKYVKATTKVSYYLYDESATLIEEHTELTAAGSTTLSIVGLEFYNTASTTDLDDLGYFNAPRPSIYSFTLGSEENLSVTPDCNIWQVDGYDLNAAMPAFSYSANGNLTITFRTSDADADDLNFNMWCGTSANAKTNKITGDINLSTDAEQGNCDTNAKTGMVCEWDWGIASVADNNYWITIEINDGTDSNTATTQKSFKVNPIPAGALRIEADVNVTKKLNVIGDANFVNVGISGQLFGGSPLEIVGQLIVKGTAIANDYLYLFPGSEEPKSLVQQLQTTLQAIQKITKTIEKMTAWNSEQDQRIATLENELCKYNNEYKWCSKINKS